MTASTFLAVHQAPHNGTMLGWLPFMSQPRRARAVGRAMLRVPAGLTRFPGGGTAFRPRQSNSARGGSETATGVNSKNRLGHADIAGCTAPSREARAGTSERDDHHPITVVGGVSHKGHQPLNHREQPLLVLVGQLGPVAARDTLPA